MITFGVTITPVLLVNIEPHAHNNKRTEKLNDLASSQELLPLRF